MASRRGGDARQELGQKTKVILGSSCEDRFWGLKQALVSLRKAILALLLVLVSKRVCSDRLWALYSKWSQLYACRRAGQHPSQPILHGRTSISELQVHVLEMYLDGWVIVGKCWRQKSARAADGPVMDSFKCQNAMTPYHLGRQVGNRVSSFFML